MLIYLDISFIYLLGKRSEKIKKRKPTGKKVKKKSGAEISMINRNYITDSNSVNICQDSKDYENVTAISGNENEFPEKTSKVIFHSSVDSLRLDSEEADKKPEDDVCPDKKSPSDHDIDQDDKEDNGNVSDSANRKVIIANETVDMDHTAAARTKLEEAKKPVIEEVPPDHASSKIPKYIKKSKLQISIKRVKTSLIPKPLKSSIPSKY